MVHFDRDPEETKRLEQVWREADLGVALEIEPAPYREIVEPLIRKVRRLKRDGAGFVTVVFGQLVPRWWQRPLHADEARRANAALLLEPATAVATVPYPL